MLSVKIDMHVHSVYSKDSLIRPDELIEYGIRKGLDGLVICDHDSLAAYKLLKSKAIEKNFLLIPGMEIETHIGEVIGIFINEEMKIRDQNFFSVVDTIKDSNGLIIVPHPFDFLRNNHLKMELLNDRIINKYIDGIEIMNSRIIFPRCIKKAENFNRKYNRFETGGSDAHTKKELGKGYTLIFDLEDRTENSIRKSLLARKSKSMGVRSSPLVHAITVLNKFRQGLYSK